LSKSRWRRTEKREKKKKIANAQGKKNGSDQGGRHVPRKEKKPRQAGIPGKTHTLQVSYLVRYRKKERGTTTLWEKRKVPLKSPTFPKKKNAS